MSDYQFDFFSNILRVRRWETVAVTESRYAQDSYGQAPFVLIQELRATRRYRADHDLMREIAEDPYYVLNHEAGYEDYPEWPFRTRVVVAEDSGDYELFAHDDGTDAVKREVKRLPAKEGL